MKGEKFSLEGHRLIMVGRDASCTIQIVDPKLSRHHLQIEYVKDEDRHYAIDFNSKNGVLVNGTKVEGRAALNDQDAIVIGDSTIVYSLEDSPYAQHVLASLKRFGEGHMHTQTND
jgi:pSer/pThr/pTyr-binding forkhead associated (FHA) protein